MSTTRSRPHRPAAAVPFTAATEGPFEVTLLAEGILQSDKAVTVRAGKAPGQLTMIAPDGTVVKVGDVFCRIDARDLETKRIDAELADKQAREEVANSRETALQQVDMDQRNLAQTESDFKVWTASTTISTKEAEQQLAYDQAEAKRLQLEYDRDQRMADKGYQAGTQAEVSKATWVAQVFKAAQSDKDPGGDAWPDRGAAPPEAGPIGGRAAARADLPNPAWRCASCGPSAGPR